MKSCQVFKALYRLMLMVGFVMSYALITFSWVYASAGESLEERRASIFTASYRQADDTWLAEEKERAVSYNAALFREQCRKGFSYLGEEASDAVYESLLADKTVMAYLEIPVLDLVLPVVHGMKSQALESQVGHFYKTSLPVGGPSTHCVLAAHSALPDARLFTDLKDLAIGDEFKLHVLDETLTYKVTSVRVVLPEEADSFLGIVEGRDLVTLYTCTPYAVNTHRLLVRGERVPEGEPSGNGATCDSMTVLSDVQTQSANLPRDGRLWLFSLVTVLGLYGLSLYFSGRKVTHE